MCVEEGRDRRSRDRRVEEALDRCSRHWKWVVGLGSRNYRLIGSAQAGERRVLLDACLISATHAKILVWYVCLE